MFGNVTRVGLVCEAHRLMYHIPIPWQVESDEEEEEVEASTVDCRGHTCHGIGR